MIASRLEVVAGHGSSNSARADARRERLVTPNIVFDVSGLRWRAGRIPSGLPRVQLGIASVLVGLGPEVAEFCEWDQRRQVFTTVAPEAVLAIARQNQADVGVDRPGTNPHDPGSPLTGS